MGHGVYSVKDNNKPIYTVKYKIRKGDNLETISKATGIPVQTLAKENNIKDPNWIYSGDNLELNIYGYKIINMTSKDHKIKSYPDDFTNNYRLQLPSKKEKYEAINAKGASVWLNEHKN